MNLFYNIVKHFSKYSALIILYSCTTDVSMIGEGSSLLKDNRKVNALTYQFKGNEDTLFRSLEKDFGKPITDSSFQVFNINNSDWSNKPLTLRVEIIETISLENEHFKQVFFTVETIDKEDLLIKNTESQISVKKYLAEKYLLIK